MKNIIEETDKIKPWDLVKVIKAWCWAYFADWIIGKIVSYQDKYKIRWIKDSDLFVKCDKTNDVWGIGEYWDFEIGKIWGKIKKWDFVWVSDESQKKAQEDFRYNAHRYYIERNKKWLYIVEDDTWFVTVWTYISNIPSDI